MKILGIDPGLGGGVVVVDQHTRKIVAGFRMPTYKEGNKRAVSPNQLLRLIPLPIDFAVVERVHSMPGQGVSSTFSFGRAYGVAVAVASFVCSRDVVLVTPQTWKRRFDLTGKGKEHSIGAAKRVFKGSYVWKYQADDGIAEAALMAAWLIDTRLKI